MVNEIVNFYESIRFKLLRMAVTATIIALLLLLSASYYIYKPVFSKLEHNKAQIGLCQIQQAFESEILQTNLLCKDWATRNDIYKYIDNANQDNIDSILSIDSYINNKLNLIHIYDSDGHLVFGECYDLKSKNKIELRKHINTNDSLSEILIPENNDYNKIFYSFTYLKNDLYLATVSRPIMSNDDNTLKGTLMLGRFLDADFFDRVKYLTGKDFQVTTHVQPNNIQGFTEIPDYKGKIFKSFNYKFTATDNKQQISTAMFDDKNNPVFIITSEIEGKNIDLATASAIYILIAITIIVISLCVTMCVAAQNIVLKPLNVLVLEIEEILCSTNQLISKAAQRNDEFGYLAQQYNCLLSNIQAQSEQLEMMATSDSMTGILNHNTILDKLENEMSRSMRYDSCLSVAIIDIDYFKQINDSFGHQAGDVVIKTITDTINDLIRDTDIFGRYGGDEFLLILIEQNIEGAALAVKRIYDAIANINWEYPEMKVTLSCGIAELNDSIFDAAQLIEKADNNLYKAKADGRNCFVAESELPTDEF